MSDSASTLIIRVSGDVKDFNKALEEAKKKTEDLQDVFKDISKYGAVAFAATTAEIGLSVKSFGEAEAAAKKLNLAIQNQGLNVDRLGASYKDQAVALEKLTGIDDDRITQGQAILQGLIGQVAITGDMTKAAVDLSTQTGDLNSAFEILGRGIEGNTKGLKQFGITIEDGLPKQERMRQIVEKLNQKFGDQATVANQGVGSVKSLGTAFGNLQEDLGQRFAPIFTAVVQKMTEFINMIRENQGLVTWTASIIAAVAALSGIVAIAGSVISAYISLSAAATAFGVSVGIATGGITLLITAFGLLTLAAAKYAGSALDTRTETEKMEDKIESLRAKIEQTKATIERGGLGTEVLKTQLSGLEGELKRLETNLERAQQLAMKKENASSPDDRSKADAAKKAADEEDRVDRLRIEKKKQNLILELLITEDHSSQLIELKKKEIDLLNQLETEKNANMRGLLQQQLEQTRQIEADANATDAAQRGQFQQDVLAQNEEFQAMSDEQKQVFLAKNKADLTSQQLTEKTARDQNALDKANVQIKSNNTFLLEQQKFGTAYALINKVMHSVVIQGTAQAFGELAQMQSSSSATLKSIGKAAAVANIIMSTAVSAMRIYEGFSTIPIIGPALGVAGAAAAIAFGAERVGQVSAAAEGGIMQGGRPGVDSIMTLMHPGEFAVPRPNFEETVTAVANQRNLEAGRDTAGVPGQSGGTTDVNVMLTLKENVADFVQAEILMQRRLGKALI